MDGQLFPAPVPKFGLAKAMRGNDPARTLGKEPRTEAILAELALAEKPYFCALCGVGYDIDQNQSCFCHPNLEE